MMLSFLELFFETGRIYFIVNRDTDSNPEFVNICRMDVSRSQPVEALFEQTMDFSDVISNVSQDLLLTNGSDGSLIEYEAEDEYRVSAPVAVLLILAYGLVFLIGVVGNSFVVAVVARSPRMKTPTNFFIVNLALADLLVLVLCLPTTLITNIYSCKFGPWPS